MKSIWSIVLGLGLSASVVAQERVADPFTPQVTRQQAERIQKAGALSAESLQGAAEWLKEETEGGAAEAFTLGNLYFQMERYEDAVVEYKKAISSFPGFRDARENLGRVEMARENVEEAVVIFQGLVEDGLADAEVMLLLGHGLMMGGHAISAESAYRQALLRDQTLKDARIGLIQSAMAQERYADARAWSREVLMADAANADVWAVRANAELALGLQKDAIRTLEQARRLEAVTSDMEMTLAELYGVEGLDTEAAGLVKGLIAKDAEEVDAERVLRWVNGYRAYGKVETVAEIMKQLEAVIPRLPQDRQEAVRKGLQELEMHLALDQGAEDRGLEIAGNILKDDPMNGEAALVKAEVLRGKKEYARAAVGYERATRIPAVAGRAWMAYAQMEIERGEMGAAISHLERIQGSESGEEVQNLIERLKKVQQ